MKRTTSQRPKKLSSRRRSSDSGGTGRGKQAKGSQTSDQKTAANASSAREAVWQVLAAIPRGRVAAYGQVAALAGLPGRARWVGRLLAALPEDTALPWHRVVTASGQLADRPGVAEQRRRLQAEGVLLRGRRVPRDRFWLD